MSVEVALFAFTVNFQNIILVLFLPLGKYFSSTSFIMGNKIMLNEHVKSCNS